jgi:hypothetical protein
VRLRILPRWTLTWRRLRSGRLEVDAHAAAVRGEDQCGEVGHGESGGGWPRRTFALNAGGPEKRAGTLFAGYGPGLIQVLTEEVHDRPMGVAGFGKFWLVYVAVTHRFTDNEG